MKKLLLLSLILFPTLEAMNGNSNKLRRSPKFIHKEAPSIPTKISKKKSLKVLILPEGLDGQIRFYYKDGEYHLVHNGKDYQIKGEFLDEVLQNFDEEQLENFFAAGRYLQVIQLETGKFSLRANKI